jgi:predicted SprT family Zn-dependent metalloprotease
MMESTINPLPKDNTMDLHKAEILALDLMRKYEVWDMGYRFRWSNTSRILGQCNYVKKHIKLSRRYVAYNDERLVEDTIRHEIAHALCGPGYGHGPYWKKMAAAVGANPRACKGVSDGVVSAPEKYNIVCTSCNNVLGTCSRRLKETRRRGGQIYNRVSTCCNAKFVCKENPDYRG